MGIILLLLQNIISQKKEAIQFIINLKNINLKYVNFKLSKLYVGSEASKMFFNCKLLTSIDLSRLNVTNTLYFDSMFYGCKSLKTINLKSFNFTKAIKIDNMFYGCSSLQSLDLSNFKPLHLTNMSGVFRDCISLTSINLNDFYTHNVNVWIIYFIIVLP